MILQVGVRFIPPPDIAGTLTQLGQSIGNIIAPQQELRRNIALLLLTNPELGAQLASAQRQLERQRQETVVQEAAQPPRLTPEERVAVGRADQPLPAAATAEARRLEPPPVNVLPFLPPEFTRAILTPFPETQEERLKVALGRDQEFFQNQVQVAKETLFNQLITLEVDTETKRRIGQSIEDLDSLLDSVSTDPLTQAAILAGIREQDLTGIMQTLLQLESNELVALIRAKSQQALTPLDMVQLVAERMALQTKTNNELTRLAEAIAEAPREMKPLEISNLRNTLALRDQQFKDAGIDLQSTIELEPELSIILRRLQGVELREITFPDLNLKGENIDPADAVDVANAALNQIEVGVLEADFNKVRAAIVDTSSGLELFTGMSPRDQQSFVQGVLDAVEARRKAADEATLKEEAVKDTPEELRAKIATNEAGLERLRVRARGRLGVDRPGLTREQRLNLEAAASIRATILTDHVTGKTGKELQDEIDVFEGQIQAFPKPPREFPIR